VNPRRYADMFIGISVGMLAIFSSVESQVAALVASDQLFGRESDSGSEVVGSLVESKQWFLSTNPTIADTLRP
jgi:hypothetical protein